jgi:hypothetical protein
LIGHLDERSFNDRRLDIRKRMLDDFEAVLWLSTRLSLLVLAMRPSLFHQR